MHTNIWKSTTAPNATDCGSGYTDLIWYNTTNNQAYRYNTTSGLWTLWITGSGGTGGGGVVETTYADLKSLYDASTLTPGQWYLITDYRTIYKQADTSILMGQASTVSGYVNPSMIYQLLVLATGISAIAHEAYVVSVLDNDGTTNSDYTPLCNQWKVWYDINNNTSLYSWATSSGMGVIYRLIDHKNNDLPYDFYNIRFRLYAPAYSSYSIWASNSASSYTVKTIVRGDVTNTQLYVRIRNNNTNAPATITNYTISDWKLMFASTNNRLTQNGVVMYYDGSAYATIAADTTTYTDYLTFNSDQSYENKIDSSYDSDKLRLYTNVFMGDTYQNHFGYNMRDNVFYGSTYQNEILHGFRANHIASDFYQNTIDVAFSYNSIQNTPFYGNTVGNKCLRNSFGFSSNSDDAICYNQIANNFNCNTIYHEFKGNVIGNSASSNYTDTTFKFNRIGNNFYYNNVGKNCQYNTCESDFHDNTIGCNFVNNTIGNDFYHNAIGYDMKRNIIGNRCNGNSIGNYCKMNTIGSSFEDGNIGNSFGGCNIGHAVSLTANDNLHFVTIPTMNYGYASLDNDSAGEQSAENIDLVNAIKDTNGNIVTSFDGIYGLKNNSYLIRNIEYKEIGNVTTDYTTYKAFYYNSTGAQTFIF